MYQETHASASRETRQRATWEAWLLTVGAALLICAPLLPGLSRVVVLPALLLAPGQALLRLLGLVDRWRSFSIAVPTSLVSIACAALILDVSGIKLDAVSLGSILGATTALCLAGSYARQLWTGSTAGAHRTTSHRSVP